MRLDFLGVGFNRSGSKWLTNCLYEHPEVSIPEFCLLTEINYFPEEYELTGLKNYIKKFKDCDFTKKVGELSVMTIFKKRSAKLIKKLFPNTKIIIYRRREEDRVESRIRCLTKIELRKVRGDQIRVNQEELIEPWKKEFEKNLFIFDMDKEGKEKLKEYRRLCKFLGIRKYHPKSFNTRPNQSKKEAMCRFPALRKTVNLFKYGLRNRNRKLFYKLKRFWGVDYYFQWVNRRI